MKENSKEIEILKKITNLISNYLYINNLNSTNKIDIINIPKDIVDNFIDKYFNQYEETLIKNSLIYALSNEKKDYLKLYLNNQTNFNEYLKLNNEQKLITTRYALQNIYTKIVNNINNDNQIIESNPNYFKDNYDYIFITELYRMLLLELINPKLDNDVYNTLDQIFYTNKLDKEIIKQFCTFTKQDLYLFKKIVIRFLLSDNFVYFESLKYDLETEEELSLENEDEFIEELDEDFNIEGIQEYEVEVDDEILDYIYECIENNTFILPEDNDLRYRIYETFIKTNVDIVNKQYDLINIEDNNKTLELKKINPLYLLEKGDY